MSAEEEMNRYESAVMRQSVEVSQVKKPKFKNKMAVVQPLQELFLKAQAGSVLKLQWRITNTSKNRAWPIQPQIKNFSNYDLFGPNNDLN